MDYSFISDPDLRTMARNIEEEDITTHLEAEEEDPVSDPDEMVEWDSYNKDSPSDVAPNCGGLFLTDEDKVIAFVGTDPNARVNVWSYDPAKSKYVANKASLVKGYSHQKGPVLNGQFRPSSLKEIKKVEETCKLFKGTKFDGLTGKDGGAPQLALTTYKQMISDHLIKNGMWDVFQYVHPKTKKTLCLSSAPHHQV